MDAATINDIAINVNDIKGWVIFFVIFLIFRVVYHFVQLKENYRKEVEYRNKIDLILAKLNIDYDESMTDKAIKEEVEKDMNE